MSISHEGIFGKTRSGKTTLALIMFLQETGIRIFFNTMDELSVRENSNVIVNSFNTLSYALEEKYRKICYQPPENERAAKVHLIEIRNILFKIGRALNRNRHNVLHWCTIYIDEIHEFTPKHQPSPTVDSFFKRGARFGIKAVAISQRPADVSQTVLTQTEPHYIFKCNPYETPYFQKYKLDMEEYSDWIKKPYHFLRWDGSEVMKVRPVALPKQN